MSHPLVLLIVLGTSALVLLPALLRGGRPLARLGRAVLLGLETLGAVAVFMAMNVAVGMTVVLGARALSPYYFSLYEVADIALLVLSAFQALVYQAWRAR